MEFLSFLFLKSISNIHHYYRNGSLGYPFVNIRWNSRCWKDPIEFFKPVLKRFFIRPPYELFINDSKPVKNQKWSFHESIDDHTEKLSSNSFQFQKRSTRSKLQHTFKNVSAQCERADDKFDFLSFLSSRKQMFSNSKFSSKNFSVRNDPQFEGRQLRKAKKPKDLRHHAIEFTLFQSSQRVDKIPNIFWGRYYIIEG